MRQLTWRHSEMVASCRVASSQSRRKLWGRAKGLPPDTRRLKAALLMAAELKDSLRPCKHPAQRVRQLSDSGRIVTPESLCALVRSLLRARQLSDSGRPGGVRGSSKAGLGLGC